MTYGIIGFVLLIVMVLLLGSAFRKSEEEKKLALNLGIAILMIIVGTVFLVVGKTTVSLLFLVVGALMILSYFEMKGKLPEGFGELPEADREATEPLPEPKSMSRAQAYKILGLTEKPTKKEINAAYRKMMMKHHPDKEGKSDNAAKLNAARDALLKGE